MSTLLLGLLLALVGSALAQPTLTIGANTRVAGSGAAQLVYGGGALTNNGALSLPAGQLTATGPITYGGGGTGIVATALFNHGPGISTLNSLLSVTGRATLSANTALNANGQLYLRTDQFPNADLVNNGILTGTVQGLVTRGTVLTGNTPYNSVLSHNVSGTSARYHWQSSTDNSAWTDIPGAIAPTYTTNVNATAYYRCRLTTTNSPYDQTTPAVLLTFTGTVAPAQPIRYVKAGSAGDGSSWANASGNLQAMIDISGVEQVWVAGGLYKPTTGTDRTVSFQMKNNVAIYGGFLGNETDRNNRPSVNPLTGAPSSTTLSGDIGTPGDRSDNSYHVINNRSNSLNNTAVLDGVVITGGNANGSAFTSDDLGGGIYNINSSPTLTNCSLLNNAASVYGGGISNFDSSPMLTNCRLQGNSASYGGGGILNSSSSPALTNCRLLNNTAKNGGGILNVNSSSPTLTNCSLQGNSATDDGGSIYNDGSSPTLANCSLLNNKALSNGGGIYNIDYSSPILINCSLQNNEAGIAGGGIHNNSSSSPTLTNCSLLNNTAKNGGGIFNSQSSPTLTNCSLQGNSATSGGGIYNQSNSTLTLANCVLWNNGADNTIFNAPPGDGNPSVVSATYSLFDNSVTGYKPNGTGNKTTSSSPFASANDVVLAPNSPAIDAGSNEAYGKESPETDLVGNPRIFPANGRIDMGAIESQTTPVSALSVAVSASPDRIQTTGTTTLSASVLGGTGPYSYTFAGSVGTISPNGNTASVSNLPAGVQTFTVTVADATTPTRQTTSASVSVTVTQASTPPMTPALPNQTATVGTFFGYTVPSFGGTEPVTYTASGLPDGLMFDPATRVISGAPTKVETPTVDIFAQNAAGVSAGQFTITVNPAPIPTRLTVLQRDPDNGQLGTNTLKPYLQLRNDGTAAIPYSEITVRYWLTVEEPAPLMFQVGSQLGNGNVQLQAFPVSPVRQGADTYVEYSFRPGAGSLPAGGNSGEIQTSILKENYSGFNQGNDYSYVLNRDANPNPRITAYRNGQLVYGTEPGGVVNAPLMVMLTANPTTITTAGTTTLLATVSGGTGPYTYSFSGPGTIVPNGNTATVSGLSATIHTFTVRVTDLTAPANQTVSASVSVQVNPAPPANTAPVATANANQTATVGQAFTYTVNTFTDNETPNNLTYSASISPLNGFGFNPGTRVISGMPSATGVSSVTITASDPDGSSANTIFTITVKPAPVVVTPLALTFTASPTMIQTTGTTTLSVTVSGGTGPYGYVFSGSGTIAQNGTRTATVSNLPAGVQTFTVVVSDATQPSSQTLSGTVSVTVSAVPVATQLTVLQRDPDNGQLNTNTLKPYLQLRNDGTAAIPYREITVRYWLTVENPAPLVAQVGSQLGNGNVTVNYVPLSPVRPGATGYLEFSFTAGAGSLAGGSNSGDIQTSVRKENYSGFNQGDDYSYVLNRDFAANPRITAYRNSQLIYGTEPGSSKARLATEATGVPLHVLVLGNPVVGDELSISVTGAAGQSLRLRLTNTQGTVVSERTVARAGAVEQQRLPVGSQAAGLLFLEVTSATQTKTVKVLKAQ